MSVEILPVQTSPITLGPLTFEHAALSESQAVLLQLLNNQHRQTTLIGFINPHVFNLACQYDEVARFITQCRLCCIDGIGVHIAARLLCRPTVTRIVAEELFNLMLSSTAFNSNAVLIGVTRDEVAAATVAINQASPSINIIDCIDGFQSDANYNAFLADHLQTDLILIGAGTPRSEQIALLAHQFCQRAVVWHIGAGTIKTWAGTKRRAPGWISRLGMQWLHRMWHEPHTRSRYLSGGLRFIENLSNSSQSDHNGAAQ
ncbi:MAG: WecB/TagA/CpsF family glycosyltransferase [Granulosicoccaceae bacterium]